MAFILGDSFDLVSSASDLVASGVWTFCDTNYASFSATSRFNFGQSLKFVGGAGSTICYRNSLSASSNTVYFAFSLLPTASNGSFISGRDAGSAQFTVIFDSPNNNIVIKTGNYNGTTVATFTNAFTNNIWTHFQIKVLIDVSVGEIYIRKNGNTVDDFSATNINTRDGTSNNFLTGVGIGPSTFASIYTYIDDFLMFDNTGPTLNTWTGDLRCYVVYPNGNGAQTQFTPVAPNFPLSTDVSSSFGINSGTLYMSKSYTLDSGIVNSATLNLASITTGNINIALYDGSASTVIATATPLSNPVIGLMTFTFPSPPTITNNSYRIAVLTDTTRNLYSTSNTTTAFYSTSYNYSSGFPSSPIISTGTTKDFYLKLNMTITNWQEVDDNGYNDGDITYNYNATVGGSDLYTLQPLPTTPSSISVAQLRVIARKSDSGTRGFQPLLVSGNTTVTGNTQILGTSYQHYISQYPVDPNTNAGWTAGAINSLQVGVIISV